MSEGSEGSPARAPRRRIKKVLVVSSTSDSDSDGSIIGPATRRKRLRVLSDEDGGESSGSSVVARRKRLPKLRDSDADSDSSGWATDRSDAEPAPDAPPPASGFASDSSEGNSDKCSICLLRFKDQEVGTPQTCEHIFCLDCITEWSKNVNTCPVDRITFNSIVVRACAGGRVLRTEPVKVLERRLSVEVLVIEDLTACQVCGSVENEETMLLCDGCDLGYHMQCLDPPLTEVPLDQWLCPNCDDHLGIYSVSDLHQLFRGYVDLELPAALREPRNVRRSSRGQSAADEPSTSSGRRENVNSESAPSTSRTSNTRRGSQSRSSRTTTRRRTTGTHRRKYKRRRTKTVVIEYELEENGKFPVTKTIKRRVKKRRTKKRQPRTAARRSHVRASVRAKLATLQHDQRRDLAQAAGACAGVQDLSVRRRRAGIPSLSLFGNPNQLDYFSEEEYDVSEGASTAVAARPTLNILSAYRQARRKMVTIPSPPHAAAAPDVLSSILESQARLHSRRSVVSVDVDGQVNIKLQTPNITKKDQQPTKTDESNRVDVTKGSDDVRKVPSYPGGSGGRGWGGGYRGNYHRDHNTQLNSRGGHDGYGYQNRQNNYQNNNGGNMRRDDNDTFNNYGRRPHQYEDSHFDRARRPPEANRPNYPNQRPNEGRYSLNPSWQPYGAGPRPEAPPQARHSFGGFENNPLDMRVGPAEPQPQQQPYRPLPEPPMFKFDKTPEVEKSEDEKSDPGLIIDTEKYDPTEPTHDDSGDERSTPPAEARPAPGPAPAAAPLPPPPTPPPPPALPSPPAPPTLVQNILANIDTSTINASNINANVLDNAVRQVLQEHRNLMAPSVPQDRSDDDSDGDCPNFSIYSAASVHIANTSGLGCDVPYVEPPSNPDEDLVQQDDDIPLPEIADNSGPVGPVRPSLDISVKNKEEEYKEKVSKRCPITTNTRNPIKIKLNTPSLIKRVSLYDEEASADIEEPTEPEEDRTSNNQGDTLKKSPQKESVTKADVLESNDKSDVDAEKEASDDERDSNKLEEETTPKQDLDESATYTDCEDETHPDKKDDDDDDDKESEKQNDVAASESNEKSDNEEPSDNDDLSDSELCLNSQASKKGVGIEKMTESISETEDERSYTPCLDENKSKDTSLETDKDKALEGLDTEMISEEEGNDMFSDNEQAPSDRSQATPVKTADGEEGEIVDKKKEKDEDGKKKKKKDSKKEGKEKNKSKSKKGEVAFKKLSKSGKERNYRERDKDEKGKSKKERRDSEDKKKRKEKRKDLERYDVRTVVTEKRKKVKDAFGRDISPHRSPTLSPPSRASMEHASSPPLRARLSPSLSPHRRDSPRKRRRSVTPRRRSISPRRRSLSPRRRSISPRRRSISPRRRSISPRRRSISPRRRSISPRRRSISPRQRATSPRPRVVSPIRRRSPTPRRPISPRRRSITPRRKSLTPRRKSISPRRKASPRRRRSASRGRKRARRDTSPKGKGGKKKKRSPSRRRRSPKKKRTKRVASPPAARSWSPGSVDSRLLSPRTPPPDASPRARLAPLAAAADKRARRDRRRDDRIRHRRNKDVPGPSKEVFTSGDNILVSVSFKDQERDQDPGDKRKRKETKRDKRRKRKRIAATEVESAKPVAIIDLDRSPFREITPSPKNVIVLSDSDHADKEAERPPPAPVAAEPAEQFPVGPKTPPEPAVKFTLAGKPPPARANPLEEPAEEARGPATPPDSPDAYDPFEPTRSPSPAAACHPPSPPRALMTLEAAQKTNLSADDVIDRRPVSPIEKVMALLQSTRDVSPEAPEARGDAPEPPAAAPPPPAPAPAAAPAPAPRILLPEPARSQAPKLFLAKPSPIKSNPVKPMQATKISRLPLPAPRRPPAPDSDPGADSPYSPGSSDFGDLFEPPAPLGKQGKRDGFDSLFDKPTKRKKSTAKVPVKLNKKKGNKTQVGVKLDDDSLKVLDDLPSSAVEMQVKSKFLKKLNRQERVVEEVKLVLKPHYNKKRVTKDEYKDILRRAVPKICHNKSGEINPTKIQALVEAYVKKFRKKHKLGLA